MRFHRKFTEIPWKVSNPFEVNLQYSPPWNESRQVLIEDRRKWVLKLLKCILKLGDCEREATWDKFLWASRRRRSDEKLGGQQPRNRLTIDRWRRWKPGKYTVRYMYDILETLFSWAFWQAYWPSLVNGRWIAWSMICLEMVTGDKKAG